MVSEFDEPMVLKTGFFRFGASEVVVAEAEEVDSFMGWISLLELEDLDFRVPPVSLVNCFISLRRCGWRD